MQDNIIKSQKHPRNVQGLDYNFQMNSWSQIYHFGGNSVKIIKACLKTKTKQKEEEKEALKD